jgi:hypothetical protein
LKYLPAGTKGIWENLLQFMAPAVRIWPKCSPPGSYSSGLRVQKMADVSENSDKGSKTSVSKEVSDYVDRLSNEHRMLVILKVQLYDGAWELMLSDLKNRLAGKPYIFKLVNRINDDIVRIEEMQQFEQEHSIDLADYVKM